MRPQAEDWGKVFYLAKVKLGLSVQEYQEMSLVQLRILTEEHQKDEEAKMKAAAKMGCPAMMLGGKGG